MGLSCGRAEMEVIITARERGNVHTETATIAATAKYCGNVNADAFLTISYISMKYINTTTFMRTFYYVGTLHDHISQ
ncbi:hypothetical protein POVWA2_054540 [Plasmodium ovale wallikeri]|uniref:Uncharacterized protein n=1 Tax=Plasmodium ovale wallikeri TaxID=864142 RepID=A0A1A8ZUT5_PLAOA|nr:hypothetical protein POVWA1_055150 [Plasmodium ovale wallikeri]SBT47675.1 hypothetical protein POVWA2_054540 [Plasmodium ovale wallikeri]